MEWDSNRPLLGSGCMMQRTVTWGMSLFFLSHPPPPPPGLGRILAHEWMSLELLVWSLESLSAWGYLAGSNGLSFNTDKGMLLSSWLGARPKPLSEWYSGEVRLSFCPLQTTSLFLISSDHRWYPKAAAPGDARVLPLQCYVYTHRRAKCAW